jgi:hypothetical protein
MLARRERRFRLGETDLRRRAQGHGLQGRLGGQHRLDGEVVFRAIHLRAAARAGDEFKAAMPGDGGQVLVPSDFPDASQTYRDVLCHDFLQ